MTTPAPRPIRMPPQICGPIFWATLHIVSLSYSDTPTDRQKQNAKNFYESMMDVLPCPMCRNHYEENLKILPLDKAILNRHNLIEWVFNMHNLINLQLGKREYTFEEFIDSMHNLEMAKKSVPPSFHETNQQNKADKKPSATDFTLVDIILLGAGSTLIAGSLFYYFYQENIRKNTAQ